MRLFALLVIAVAAHPGAGTAWARIPRACRPCRSTCGTAISDCVAAEVTSCPTAPPRKARHCARKAQRHCRTATVAGCVAACKQSGSPECGATVPTACTAFTSTCDALSLLPVAQPSGSAEQIPYRFRAYTASPGPGGCCVIDECAGITKGDATAGVVSLTYDGIEELNAMQQPTGGTFLTRTGIQCPVQLPVDVYDISNVYRVNFSIDLPLSATGVPPTWGPPYLLAADGLSVSVDSNDDPIQVDHMNSFTPPTWRLVNQTVSVDKVCAEQELMQGHATASFIKNDGTPCTVTIYAQGTRAVAGQ
jgi:hypothetical protein